MDKVENLQNYLRTMIEELEHSEVEEIVVCFVAREINVIFSGKTEIRSLSSFNLF